MATANTVPNEVRQRLSAQREAQQVRECVVIEDFVIGVFVIAALFMAGVSIYLWWPQQPTLAAGRATRRRPSQARTQDIGAEQARD